MTCSDWPCVEVSKRKKEKERLGTLIETLLKEQEEQERAAGFRV